MRWNYTGSPPDNGYVYQVTPDEEMRPVEDSEDVSHLLLWVYNHFVHGVGDPHVVAREELIFQVNKAVLQREPTWCARVEGFSVLEQKRIDILFKLAKPK